MRYFHMDITSTGYRTGRDAAASRLKAGATNGAAKSDPTIRAWVDKEDRNVAKRQ
jgi:hypothetical protein